MDVEMFNNFSLANEKGNVVEALITLNFKFQISIHTQIHFLGYDYYVCICFLNKFSCIRGLTSQSPTHIM